MTSIPARADVVYTPTNFPPCRIYKTSTGVQVCGWEDIEDYKKVLTIDIELVHVKNLQGLSDEKMGLLIKERDLLQGEVDALRANEKLLQDRDDKVTQQLIDLDKKYQDERVKPRWGSPVAWTIAGVSTAVLAGFVIYGLVH